MFNRRTKLHGKILKFLKNCARHNQKFHLKLWLKVLVWLCFVMAWPAIVSTNFEIWTVVNIHSLSWILYLDKALSLKKLMFLTQFQALCRRSTLQGSLSSLSMIHLGSRKSWCFDPSIYLEHLHNPLQKSRNLIATQLVHRMFLSVKMSFLMSSRIN